MTDILSKDSACIHLFTHLQALEPHLAGGYRVKITRGTDKAIFFSVHAIGESKPRYSVRITTRDCSTMDEVITTVAIIKEELIANSLFAKPTKCNKERS